MIRYFNEGRNVLVSVFGELTIKSAARFVMHLTEIDNEEVPYVGVVINSDGGECRAMYAMLDAINAIESENMFVCGIGTCGSAAADLLFSVNKRRVAAPNAELWMHNSYVANGKTRRAKKFKLFGGRRAQHAFLDMTDAKTMGLVAERSGVLGVDVEFIKRKIKQSHGEWIFTAEDALEYGFIDEIGIPCLEWW